MASSYTFLPWLQRGLAKKIAETDPLTNAPASAPNASVMVGVKVLADDQEKKTIQQPTVLLGPGDIVGVERNAIVKTEPRTGVTNFEPTYFPYIEFYEEDLPWRYTPAKAAKDSRLRPWLALIVLEETEFSRKNPSSDNPNRVVVIKEPFRDRVFPPSDQTWAWAHVQINDNTLTVADPANRNTVISEVLSDNPNRGSSRLLCPRRLRPDTRYFAFLIPAFEKGRVAGLGGTKQKIDAANRFESAWGNEQTFLAGHYPVFYEWNFRTKDDATVEMLARKIKPQDITGLDIGKLWMDVGDMGYGARLRYDGHLDTTNAVHQGFMPFEGAVRPLGPPTPGLLENAGPKEVGWVANLAALLNLNSEYRTTPFSDLKGNLQQVIWEEQDDPILVPPIYGRWYAQQDGNPALKPSQAQNWLEQLNLDPALRAAAGLGAEVIRQHQDDFVGRAWEQFSDPRRTLNRELLQLRFAQEVTKATYRKHLKVGTDDQPAVINRQIAITQAIHAQVVVSDSRSLSGMLSGYKGETMFVQPAYRRLTRTNGPLMKRLPRKDRNKRVIMGNTNPFTPIFFIVNNAPPFQNFNSISTRGIDPEKLRSDNFVLLKPNWFPNPVEFPRKVVLAGTRDEFKAAFAALTRTVMNRPRQLALAAVPDSKTLSNSIQLKINPVTSFQRKIAALLATDSSIGTDTSIAPGSFNPVFTEPTYEYIAQLNPELFIPNIDKILPNSAIMLKANLRFMEAFLVGLNQEMAVELLWRGFPADMNATFFRQFWDASERFPPIPDASDILPIRQWAVNSPLGTHKPLGFSTEPLVLVIKSELMKKYKNLVIYAHRAERGADGRRRPAQEGAPLSPLKTPVFSGELEPDFVLAGFELTEEQVLGGSSNPVDQEGWYFVLSERPGEMHFGLDFDGPKDSTSWNDLNWSELSADINLLDLNRHIPSQPTRKNLAGLNLHWGKGAGMTPEDPTSGNGDAAQMASILQQRPFRVFFHASTLIQKKS